MSQTFDKLDLAPAYRTVSDAIEQRIMDGSMKVGDRLPTETQLAADFGVNRSTVREGIRLLEQQGLIRREAGRRLFVSVPRYDELGSRVQRALMLHRVSFRELWEVSMVLEPAIARSAAARITPEELQAIEDNIEETRRAVEAGRRLVDLDIGFHLLVARATRNNALVLSQEPSILLCHAAMAAIVAALPPAPGRLLEAHRRVFEALAEGNGAVAEEWMRKHFIDFKRGYAMAGFDLDQPIDTAVAGGRSTRAKRPAGRAKGR